MLDLQFLFYCFEIFFFYKTVCPVLCLFPALSVLLWPLVVYHELIQRMYTGLEPILMKLDYSMKGDTEHRKHDKRSERRPRLNNTVPFKSLSCARSHFFILFTILTLRQTLCFFGLLMHRILMHILFNLSIVVWSRCWLMSFSVLLMVCMCVFFLYTEIKKEMEVGHEPLVETESESDEEEEELSCFAPTVRTHLTPRLKTHRKLFFAVKCVKLWGCCRTTHMLAVLKSALPSVSGTKLCCCGARLPGLSFRSDHIPLQWAGGVERAREEMIILILGELFH